MRTALLVCALLGAVSAGVIGGLSVAAATACWRGQASVAVGGRAGQWTEKVQAAPVAPKRRAGAQNEAVHVNASGPATVAVPSASPSAIPSVSGSGAQAEVTASPSSPAPSSESP